MSENKKKPIDAVRDSAGSMQVGTEEDGPISAMIDMGSALYAVKARAIYAIQLADQIDPDRTNAAVPNTVQRLLPIGTDHPEVARTFLTAHTLFKSDHLGSQFDEKKAVSLAFEILQDIAAMLELRDKLEASEKQVLIEIGDLKISGRSLHLPSLGDVRPRCHAFAQKLGHAVDNLKFIARLFYPKELSKKWIDSLVTLASKKYGLSDPLTKFMVEIRPRLLFMRELRNMVEHPRKDACVDVHDFRLLPNLEINPPSVEIVRDGNRIGGSLLSLMSQFTNDLVDITEMMIALLCGANVQPFTGFRVVVVERAVDRRPKSNQHQRISYGIVMNGEVHPLG